MNTTTYFTTTEETSLDTPQWIDFTAGLDHSDSASSSPINLQNTHSASTTHSFSQPGYDPALHDDGAAATLLFPRYRLHIGTSAAKSRVETQVNVPLTLYPAPAGIAKLHLPSESIAKPKLLVRGREKSPDTLELSTYLVRTTAMKHRYFRRKALARARGEPDPPIQPEEQAELDAEDERRLPDFDHDPDHPQNGGEVKICANCIARERKRSLRKKPSDKDEEKLLNRMWSELESQRIVVFNKGEIQDWTHVSNPRVPTLPLAGHAVPDSALTVELPMRIACYCRHQGEKIGFQVIFTLKDHVGNLVAQEMSQSIHITDDHKAKEPPSNMPPLDMGGMVLPAGAPYMHGNPVSMGMPGPPSAVSMSFPMGNGGMYGLANQPSMGFGPPQPSPSTLGPVSEYPMASNGLDPHMMPPASAGPLQTTFGGAHLSRHAFSTPNLVELGGGSHYHGPHHGWEAVHTPLDGTVTPRNLSRPPSPSFGEGPSKKRKGSTSGVHRHNMSSASLSNLIMTPIASNPRSREASSAIAVTPPGGPYNQPSDGYPFAPGSYGASRSFPSPNSYQNQQFYSAPNSAHHSRAPSPTSFTNALQNQVSNQAAHHGQRPGSSQAVNNAPPHRGHGRRTTPQHVGRPTITYVVPAESPVKGGVDIACIGHGFHPKQTVWVGTQRATIRTTTMSSTAFVFVAPSIARVCALPITISLPGESLEEAESLTAMDDSRPKLRYAVDDAALIHEALRILAQRVYGNDVKDLRALAQHVVRSGGHPGVLDMNAGVLPPEHHSPQDSAVQMAGGPGIPSANLFAQGLVSGANGQNAFLVGSPGANGLGGMGEATALNDSLGDMTLTDASGGAVKLGELGDFEIAGVGPVGADGGLESRPRGPQEEGELTRKIEEWKGV